MKGRSIEGILAYNIIMLLLQKISAVSVIIGVVGGVLGIGAGMAIATIFAVVLWKRRRTKRGSYKTHTWSQLCIKLQHEYCTHIWVHKYHSNVHS